MIERKNNKYKCSPIYDEDFTYVDKNRKPLWKSGIEKTCPNCKKPHDGNCDCMKNLCIKCGSPVGNITFTYCDDCFNKYKKRYLGRKSKRILQENNDFSGWDNKNVQRLYDESTRRKNNEIEELKEIIKQKDKLIQISLDQIEQMKCCENCDYEDDQEIIDSFIINDECIKCIEESLSNWKLKGE